MKDITRFIKNKINTIIIKIKEQGIKKFIINLAIRIALVLLVRQVIMG